MVGRFVNRLFALAAFCAAATSAAAQAGQIAGRVSEVDGGKGAVGVRIQAVSGLKIAAVVQTGDNGNYRIANLAPGTYAVVAQRIGFQAKRSEGIVVKAGATTTANFALEAAVTSLNEVVTTATRGAAEEKVLDAPASISVVSSEQMSNRPASTIAGQMKSVPGLSVSQGGLVQSNIVSRGFNNAFSTAMLMLQDYRNAGVPSLRVNIPFLFTGTNEDVERVEVLNGPASALYGANSANGVLHIITKSPFNSQGTTMTVDGGTQSLLRGALRHAGVFADSWGYKLSGEYFSGTDFKYTDPNEPLVFPTIAGSPRSGQAAARDYNIRRWSSEARLDYKPSQDFENILTGGITNIGSAVELTGAFGASQIKNWSYSSLQDRVRYKKFFAQVFLNTNNSGNQNATDANGTFYMRTGIPVVDKSTVLSAQLQQGFELGGNKYTMGVDYISTHPRSEGSIFGRNEGSTDILEEGAYLQSTTPLTSKLDFVWAGRADYTDRLSGVQFSPRVAFMYKRTPTENYRFSFSRAFNSPASFSYFLDQISNPNQAPGFALRAIGNPAKEGWQFSRGCDATINSGLCMHSPWVAQGPTTNVSSTAANAFPGFMAALPTIIAGLPTLSAAQKAALLGLLGPQSAGGLGTLLNSLRPTDAQVGSVLRLGSTQVQVADVKDLQPLQASFNNTWEFGYKTIIADKLRISLDLWYQLRGDVGVPITQANPLVFYDPAKLGAYLGTSIATGLIQAGVPVAVASATAAQAAAALVPLMAALPQGALSFTNTKLAPDQTIIATYQNGSGEVDVRGIDLAVDYQSDEHWLYSATMSHTGQIAFPTVGGPTNPLMSNSPKWRATGSVHYMDEPNGWSWDGTVRYTDAFPVNSGVFSTLGWPPVYQPVPASTQFDLGATWKLPIGQRIAWSLNVTNLLNTPAPTFAGTPNIGRMLVTRVKYDF
ncbi:MAG: TonB-dependent receptor [Gemmatimonadetes bacterium]|nr:TonB-dependent receptor [Gemmatimonadota bacterium]